MALLSGHYKSDEKIKVWMDDTRPPWVYNCLGWTWAVNAAEAIQLLQMYHVEEISLDHDLIWEHYPGSGVDPKDYSQPTGFAVIHWMKENNTWPKKVIIHTMNPEQGLLMVKACSTYTTTFRRDLLLDI